MNRTNLVVDQVRKILWTAGLVIGAVACANGAVEPAPVDPLPPGELVGSQKARITSPEVSPEDAAALASDNTEFALKVYDAIREDHENLIFSPHSISLALGMTYAGARNETATEMETALEFHLGQERLHPAFNALDLSLAARNHEGFLLRIVNQLFGRTGAYFEAPFLDLLAEQYGAAMRLLDFAGDTEGSRTAINEWVEAATEDRIQELLPQGMITGDTRLVLVNAIYFLADWALQFEKDFTSDGTFHAPASDVTVPFMAQLETFAYASGDGFQAIELPYDGLDAAMLLLVPDSAAGLPALESSLSAELIDEVVNGLTPKSVDLALPKFEFTTPLPLNDTLRALGMVQAFQGGVADFTGISGPNFPMYISDVIHKAFIKIDEEGTEAAAATAVVMRDASVPYADVVLHVDRPFVFLIRDRVTGLWLFLGRVGNPRT